MLAARGFLTLTLLVVAADSASAQFYYGSGMYNQRRRFGAPHYQYTTPSYYYRARTLPWLYPAVPYSELVAYEGERTSEGRGYLIVSVPTADAKVWINDRLMTQGGTERTFMTPVLGSGSRSYSFDIKAGWTDDLGSRTQMLPVQVRPGETKYVSFPSTKAN